MSFLTRSKSTLIVAWLVALPLCVLVFSSIFHNIFFHHQGHSWRVEKKIVSGDPQTQYMDNLGYVGGGVGQYREQRWFGDQLVADVTHTLDGRFRKVVGAKLGENELRNIIFYGGSFVEGIGLNDHETLASQTQKRLPDWNIYNMAFSGWGGQQLLWMVENGWVEEHVKNDRGGVLIYGFIRDHINRFLNKASVALYNPHIFNAAYYDFKKDKPFYAGTFRQNFPIRTWLYLKLTKTSLGRDLLNRYNPKPTPTEARLFCQYLKHTAEVLEQEHKFKLMIFYYPADPVVTALDDCLKGAVPVIEVQEELLTKMAERDLGLDERDPHPNATQNMWLSDIIAREISTKVSGQ